MFPIPPWANGDNGADIFSADRVKCRSFGSWHALIHCPDKPHRDQIGPVFMSCFLHCLWKCSRFLNIHRRTLTFPSKLFCLLENMSLKQGRSERKGFLALNQTSHQGCCVLKYTNYCWVEEGHYTRSMPVCVCFELRTLVLAHDHDARSLFQCHSAILSLF